MSSTERVRKWRAEQRRKAQLYDQLEAARRAYLERQYTKEMWRGADHPVSAAVKWAYAKALNDPLCFSIFDKA